MNVLVTGGTGARGGAVTSRLVKEGHRVATTWVVEKEIRDLQDGGELMLVEADVTNPDSVADAVAAVKDRFGSVDGLVHLVGAWSGGQPVHEHSDDLWVKMIELNLTSAFICARAVLPGMIERDHGRIVMVSTRTAERDRSGQVAYAVAKAGVEILAQTIAEENVRGNVTANVIAPSTLDTPANRAAIPNGDPSKWAQLDDVASAIAYLMSDAAGPLRGARLPLYGGVI